MKHQDQDLIWMIDNSIYKKVNIDMLERDKERGIFEMIEFIIITRMTSEIRNESLIQVKTSSNT